MKRKSFFLLLIFLLSLIPFESVRASSELSRALDNSVSLMYVSDAILLNEIVDDETNSISKVSSRTLTGYLPDETTDLINQMINATKQQRNDHDRKCRETVEIYRQQGKTCEVDQTNAYCTSKRAELSAKIAALRKKRGGDNRKWFTKQWHGLKRAGAKFWHRIGPLGRKFLSEIGPQALKIVAAGGPGTEALLKNLIKHTAKNMARQRMKQIGFHALQRILKVQIEVATAAGVDICEEKEEETPDDQSVESSTAPWDSSPELDIASIWICSTNVGPWGTWMQNGDPNTRIDLTELTFNLQTTPPRVTFDFSFHGLGGIPLYSAEGNFYDHLNTEEISYGEGVAEWDETTFYGTVTVNKESYLYYPSNTDEFKDRFDRAVIGALSPDRGEIHLCFHTHTKEQFNSIKQQLFDQFKSHCTSEQYFICSPTNN